MSAPSETGQAYSSQTSSPARGDCCRGKSSFSTFLSLSYCNMADKIPKFSDLPLDKNGPHHNAWGLYGKDDQLGTLNRLSDSIVKAAAQSEIQTGTRINLDWPLDAQGDLAFFGRHAFHKEVYQKAPRSTKSYVLAPSSRSN